MCVMLSLSKHPKSQMWILKRVQNDGNFKIQNRKNISKDKNEKYD